MILYISYEEARALQHGARSFLGDETQDMCSVAAPPAARAEISALVERPAGDLDVDTLAEQRSLTLALSSVVDCLRVDMEALVGNTHPAHEGAVEAYFHYAHALSVLQRMQEMGSEMEAMIEVMTDLPVDGVAEASFHFPN